MKTSYLKAHQFTNCYPEWMPNLPSDREKDSNLCFWESLGPHRAYMAVPTIAIEWNLETTETYVSLGRMKFPLFPLALNKCLCAFRFSSVEFPLPSDCIVYHLPAWSTCVCETIMRFLDLPRICKAKSHRTLLNYSIFMGKHTKSSLL